MCALLVTPAFATLAPEYYQRARRDADSVVIIAITHVEGLPRGTGHGTCMVHGRVVALERGTRFARGSTLSVGVPCAKPNAQIPSGPVIWQDHDALRRSRWGRAFLTPEGGLALYQYDILPALPD